MSELAGIIKNGLQRGWPLQEIYQSLINTGYSPQEIQMEISKFAPQNVQSTPIVNINTAQKLSTYQTPPIQEKKSASKIVIVLIILLIIVIASLGAYLWFFK